VNKIQLIGRVGADPTVTDVGDDRRVVNYTLATSETHTDKEGKKEAALWLRYL
jgi:single-strand DNA-binding protein